MANLPAVRAASQRLSATVPRVGRANRAIRQVVAVIKKAARRQAKKLGHRVNIVRVPHSGVAHVIPDLKAARQSRSLMRMLRNA